MDGTKSAKKELPPTLGEVHETFVKSNFHGFVVPLTESLNHIAKRLIAVGQTLAHSAKDGGIGVAKIFAIDVKIVVSIAHDEFHLMTHILIIVLGDNVFDESYALFNFLDHSGLQIEHRQKLLEHAGKFASFASFALLELAAEFGGYGNEVKDVASVNMFVYVVHCSRSFPFSASCC